jgi:melanoma-associated antigen
VRYALACEYTRTPIRREDISKKGTLVKDVTDLVLEGKYPRAFTQVFEQTQIRLQSVFRMRLAELPAKEKHETIQQQRRSMRFNVRVNK